MSQACLSESHGEGNTLPRARRWCFTLNNYIEEDLSQLSQEFNNSLFIIGKEVGENGTKHLQGYVEFKNQTRFSTLKKICERAHWETAKGNREANVTYCSKDANFITNITVPKPLKIITELRPWQKEIEDIVKTEPDDRTIYWYWESKGNVGKTALIKYLLKTYSFCEFSRATKSADILTIANESKTCYLFDFARSQEGFAPYMALEQLKDGLISDSKLKKESRNIIMNPPHIICFANWEPDTTTLSTDRWHIRPI